jgi:type IX secretion system PorP/SprF family membrane protein
MVGKNDNIAVYITILMKRAILCWLILFISIYAIKAQQDPQFSQNYLNQLSVNPGFAGSSELINVSLLNRYQWVGFPGAPVTTVFNVDASLHLIGNNDGLGMTIMNDVIGYEKNVSVGFLYSWRTHLGTGTLGSGVSLGIMNKNLKPGWAGADGSDLVNLSDPEIPQQETNGILADIGIGLFYQDKDYYLALSAKHINQPSFSYEQAGRYSLLRTYYLAGGYNLKLDNEMFELLPSFFFKTDATSYQVDLNMIARYDKRLWGGLGYRLDDAVILLLGAELRNGIRFGYAYDISTSALSRYNSGSHEVYLSYSVLLGKKKTHKYKSVRFL